uniref:Transcriptional regulator n=1 Tax=Meloidogyne hapla TaxID=6305 RepID=A0A1I8B1Q7_MELHA
MNEGRTAQLAPQTCSARLVLVQNGLNALHQKKSVGWQQFRSELCFVW